MPTIKKKLHHALFRRFSKEYDLKYRAANEAGQWEREGYNYRELWRHHSLFIKETGSIYIAISKSANSSMRRALSDSTFSEAFDRKRNQRYGIFQLHHLQKTLSDVSAEGIPCMTVVRNPVDRFWSAYQDKVVQYPDYGLASEIAHFHGKDATQRTNISPEMVLDYMEQTPVHQVEEHLRPQWSCCGHGRLSFSLIAKLECLKQDLQRAVDQGLFPKVAANRIVHSNQSRNNVQPTAKQQLQGRIEAYYAKDYSAFDY